MQGKEQISQEWFADSKDGWCWVNRASNVDGYQLHMNADTGFTLLMLMACGNKLSCACKLALDEY